VDDVVWIGALSDEGVENDGERSGDELNGGEGPPARGSRRLEVEGGVGGGGRLESESWVGHRRSGRVYILR
jgi:hypothetical protein